MWLQMQVGYLISLDIEIMDVEFSYQGRSGPKFRAGNASCGARIEAAGLKESDQNILFIGYRTLCGAWNMLAGCDAKTITLCHVGLGSGLAFGDIFASPVEMLMSDGRRFPIGCLLCYACLSPTSGACAVE